MAFYSIESSVGFFSSDSAEVAQCVFSNPSNMAASLWLTTALVQPPGPYPNPFLFPLKLYIS